MADSRDVDAHVEVSPRGVCLGFVLRQDFCAHAALVGSNHREMHCWCLQCVQSIVLLSVWNLLLTEIGIVWIRSLVCFREVVTSCEIIRFLPPHREVGGLVIPVHLQVISRNG